jgi:hypothetical protein
VHCCRGRLDRKPLEAFFDETIPELDLLWGIYQGWLVDCEGFSVRTVTDLSSVAVNSSRDFTTSALDKAVNTDSRNAAIAKGIRDHGRHQVGRSGAQWISLPLSSLITRSPWQAIAFCVSVAHAVQLAATLRQHGFEAEAVHGELGMLERSAVIEGFRSGRIQVLTNCQVLTEGFDVPACDTVVMCTACAIVVMCELGRVLIPLTRSLAGRPTLSRGLYMQMLGRAVRPLVHLPASSSRAERLDRIAQSRKPMMRVRPLLPSSSQSGWAS